MARVEVSSNIHLENLTINLASYSEGLPVMCPVHVRLGIL